MTSPAARGAEGGEKVVQTLLFLQNRQQEGQGRPRPGHGDADTGKGHDAGADDLADADTHTVPKT